MNSEPYYDPEIRAAIEAGPAFPPVVADTLGTARQNRIIATEAVELSDAVARTDVIVPGPSDHPELRVRMHRREGADGLAPGLVWCHGGGYVLGTPEQDDLRFDRWCTRFDLVGAVVNYRLAPEHPYPAGLEDCYAALSWLKANGAEVGVDANRIGIGGPSAGGGLAAALALLVRDRGEFEIDYQMLIYPMIDDTRTSMTAGWHVPIWGPESNRFGWSAYLGEWFGRDDVPAHAAPTRASDLSGLPPAYVMVGSLDGFADENLDYAMRLNHAGVPVEFHLYPGAPHGFDGFAPLTAVSKQARSDVSGWLARQLDQG
ncbi:MAG: alpha/beta hydrolase [Actinomycetota bacterium]